MFYTHDDEKHTPPHRERKKKKCAKKIQVWGAQEYSNMLNDPS